jgi:hypothetical protein
MNEQIQHNDSLPPAPAEQDTVALLKKMQQQLAFLEKKIDILINQSSGRPFREKKFSRPFRSFGKQNRYDRERDTATGEKSFDRGGHFEKRHGEENREFGQQRKTYDNPPESGPGQGHQFKKRRGGKGRGFDQKNNPFSYRRKDRG